MNISESRDVLVARPASREKIREIANQIAARMPGISLESFFLPPGESCNYQWNILSTRNSALMLEWYISVTAPARGLSTAEPSARELLVTELLGDMLQDPKYSVVIDNRRVPLTVDYLFDQENWICHAAGVVIDRAIADCLGRHFSDIDVVTGPENPWLEVARFVLEGSTQGMGAMQKLARLKGGPRQVYRDVIVESAFFNRNKLYEVIEDIPIGLARRRIAYRVQWTNRYYVVPEVVGWNHAVISYIPVLFSQHPLLRRVPGFDLGPADVRFEFPEGDYGGTWMITVDYDITPIDRVRGWFNIGELQETVATLSAEVLELQRDRKALSEEAERLAGRLVEEEKERRVYQVRAAQADTVTLFFHQTSNQFLQPLMSTMIVFDDLVEIAEDCLDRFARNGTPKSLLTQLAESVSQVQEVYSSASGTLEAYRQLFHTFYEVYVTAESERDLNADLKHIQELVESGHIISDLRFELDLVQDLPVVHVEGGLQSVFLGLLSLAAQRDARHVLVKTIVEEAQGVVVVQLYHDGRADWGEGSKSTSVPGSPDLDYGLSDVMFVVETLNSGRIEVVLSDLPGYSVQFVIEFDSACPVGDSTPC
jgi:hypothetical protein